jgi:hypothetical protein
MNEAIEIGVDESLKVNGDATALFENLAKAQLEFIPVPRDSAGQVGTNRSFKYAGYATIMRCIRPALSKYGIAVLQPLHFRGGMAITTTIVAGHGASIQTSFAFKADHFKRSREGTPLGDDPQEFGRCHTYYRRYQLQSMLGIEGDSDADDLPLPSTAQFSEPALPKDSKAATPKAQPSSKEVPVAAAPKTAPAPETKSEPSATSSEPSTATESPKAAKSSPSPADLKTINVILTDALKHLKWKVSDAREFYKEHVDPAGFGDPDHMTIEQKRALHAKLVELKDVPAF